MMFQTWISPFSFPLFCTFVVGCKISLESFSTGFKEMIEKCQ